MKSFWQDLPKPFLVLAPMEGVTDTVFRRIVAKCAKPDVFMTEFTSADGFCSPGKEAVMESLRFKDEEKPVIAQLWGKNPEAMEQTAREVSGMGFAGIDINMGCPVKAVTKQGSGSAMIETPEQAKAVIAAARTDLPLSVKTRIGFKKMKTEEWITFLLEQNLDALTIHGRTAKELSKVPNHWDEIAKAVEIRNRLGVKTVIIGNGDVKDAKDATEKHREYGVDGVMIGRGIFENLWAFDRSDKPHKGTTEKLFDLMKTHILLFEKEWGGRKSFATLKKFFKIYINGFHGASDARVQFMACKTAGDALDMLQSMRKYVEK